MFIVTTIPLSRGIKKDTLDYFSATGFDLGDVIAVPLRGKETPGLVIDCQPAAKRKAELKRAGYALKKVESTEAARLFSAGFLKHAIAYAQENAISLGSFLYCLTPQAVVSNPQAAASEVTKENTQTPDATSSRHVMQASAPERRARYLELATKQLDDDQSVLIICPTIRQVARLSDFCSDKVNYPVISLTSDLTESEQTSCWHQASSEESPLIIVATAQYAPVPRPDIELVIFEAEADDSYRDMARPFINKKLVLEEIFHRHGISTLVADTVISTRTYYELKNDVREKDELFNESYEPPTVHELVEMKPADEKTKQGTIRLFSDPLAEAIHNLKANKEKMILFVARKGQRPFTVCGDCGTLVRSNETGAPLVLKEKKHEDKENERVFVDTTTGETLSAMRGCEECGSWNLTALGIGIEMVRDALSSATDLPVFQIDGDTTTTDKAVTQTIEDFYTQEATILLTTQLGLQQLETPVAHTGIITIDSLLAIPDISIQEKVFSLAIKLLLLSTETFISQTRQADTSILSFATDGDAVGFLDHELKQRRTLKLPPDYRLVKISVDTKSYEVEKTKSNLKKLLADFSPDIYQPFNSQRGNKTTVTALLRLENQTIPYELARMIASLPPQYRVDTDAASIN